MPREHLGLFDTPPDRRQVRLGFAIIGLLFVAFLLTWPVRDVRLREVDAFVPITDAIMFIGELITAALLYAQAAIFRSRALIVLGTCYFYTALLLIPHALTFPGAFAPNGLLHAGVNTTAWITILRRLAFPIAVINYVRLKKAEEAAPTGAERPPDRTLVWVLAATALAVAVTLVATRGHDLLPPLYVNRSDVIYVLAAGYESGMFALFVLATAVLFHNRNSVLDLWLLVAFSGWLIQSLLIMVLHGRFTAGWYWLYAMTVFSNLVVMLALITESNRLYARLALSISAWNRERTARLMSIDALAASVIHEVGQPLSAVSVHASAGLNWLAREQPDVERAIGSLHATLDAGQHVTDVIKSIRAMFADRPGERTEFSLNDLARATVSMLDRELAAENILLQLELDEALPPILADRVLIQRVLVNLLSNAIESLRETQVRPRRITIRSAPQRGQDVLLEISDNGVGIAPEGAERIFEVFFTTKATGSGLGLSLCRTIVGAHGGRIWASQGEVGGATFHMQMPRSGLPAA